MEENRETAQEAQEEYVPRPGWQVWGARVGLVVFIILVAIQIIRMSQGIL